MTDWRKQLDSQYDDSSSDYGHLLSNPQLIKSKKDFEDAGPPPISPGLRERTSTLSLAKGEPDMLP
jgi:hypothetical protein